MDVVGQVGGLGAVRAEVGEIVALENGLDLLFQRIARVVTGQRDPEPARGDRLARSAGGCVVPGSVTSTALVRDRGGGFLRRLRVQVLPTGVMGLKSSSSS